MKYSFFALAVTTCLTGNACAITPGGVAGWNWSVNADNITSLTLPLTVNKAPGTAGYYFANQFSFTGTSAVGYIGLQPHTTEQYMLIFSSFINGTAVLDSQHCRLGADGGHGVSCSTLYSIKTGKKYLFEVRRDNHDANTWYGFVKEEGSKNETQIGAWHLPAGSGTLRNNQAGWIEYYKNVATCSIPEVAQITVSPPYVTSNGKQGELTYPHSYGRCNGKFNYQYEFVGKDLKTTVGQPSH